MIVRRLGPQDAASWRSLRLEMLKAAPTAFGSTYEEATRRDLEQFQDWLRDIALFAAEHDGRLIGSAGWVQQSGKTVAHRGQVIAVYVQPDQRRNGVIDAILDGLAADAADSVLQLELEVAVDNLAGIRAYERSGFVKTGTTPRAMNHDGVFVDAITMVRYLDT